MSLVLVKPNKFRCGTSKFRRRARVGIAGVELLITGSIEKVKLEKSMNEDETKMRILKEKQAVSKGLWQIMWLRRDDEG